MVQIIRATKGDAYKVGIHLHNPSTRRLSDAIEDAHAKGFAYIYVHGVTKKAWTRLKRVL